MANTPELSIKVNVDPVVDGDKLVDDIEQQVKQVKELPKVHVDVDVGDFHKSLNDKLKAELKEANDKMSYYLTNLTQNSDKLNKVVNNLFADTDFSKKIVEQFKQVNTAFEQTKTILAGSNNFLDSIFKKTNLSKADDFRSLVSDTSEEIKKLYKNDIGSNEFEKQLDIVSKKAAELNIVISELTSVKTKRPDLLKSLGYNKNSYDLAIRSLKDTYDYLNDIVKSKGLSGESLITYFKDNDLFDPDTALDISDALENGLKEFEVIQQKYVDNINKLNNLKSVHIKSLTEDDMSGTFDKNRITEIAEAYTHVLSILVSQQDLLNKAKEQTLVLEDQLLSKTKFVSESMSQEVSSLQNLFSELAKSDLGKQIPALSEYMKTKAEIDSTKNTENAKAINFSASADKAQAYETALNGIKTVLGYLGKADAFSGINSNIETNADKFDNAKSSVDNYLEAIKNARTESQNIKIPKSASTGLNTDNVDAYSKKVSDIKTNLYDLKDKIFPDVYKSINVTYKGVFDNAISNAQAYIDKLKEIPDAVHNKSATKNQSARKSENLDATNIKNYAALLSGIQTGISDMKTNVIPGFDQVLNTNGQKLAQLGLVLKNYVDTYKKGLKAVEQTEKDVQKAGKVSTTGVIKTEDIAVIGDAITVSTKSVLETKDVVPPIDPVDIKGKVTLDIGDIKVPDKIDLNGNLVIKNATKEIRDATKKETGTSKTKNNTSNRDFDRKSKELLTSLASLTKGLAKTENSMKKHANGIDPEAYDEDSLYSAKIQRRIRTTKTKLTKLYKGHGGRKAWENDSIYTSAVEDAEHISHGYDASLKDDQLKQETKEFAAAEQNYLSALRERPKLYKEILDAQKKYGDNSEYVKSAQKKLTETISTIKGFESSVGSDYLNQMPERKKIFEENMSNLRKQRDDVVKQNTQIADKRQIADNKERIKSENEFLDALAKEPSLWKEIEEARKKFGDNSPEVARAKNEQSKNNDIIQKFKSGYNGSLSDIDGYDEQIRENNLNYGVYSAEIARKAQEEAQTQHDANQKAFSKARENKAKQQANSTKVTKAQQDQWLKNAEGVINEAKKKYIAAFKEVQESQKKLLQTNDQQLQADLNQRISDLRKSMKSNGDIINSYGHTPFTSEFAQNAFNEIQALRTSTRNKTSDNAALQNERDIIDDIVSSCKELQGLYKNRQQLFKPEDATELANVDQRIQNIEQHVQDLIDTSENAGISILNSSDVNNALNNYSDTVGKSNTKFSNSKLKYTIDTAKGSYIENFKKKRENEDYLSRIDQNDPKAAQMEKQYRQWIQENETAIQQAAQTLNSCHAAANDAWKEIQEVVNSSNIKDTEAANKAADTALKKNEADAKKAAADAKKQEAEDTQFFSQLNQAVNAKLRTYKAFLEAEREDPTKKSKNYIAAKGNFNDADTNFAVAVQNAVNSGLNTDSRFDNAMDRHNRNMDAIGEASDKRAKAEAEAIKVTEEDIAAIQKLEDQLDGVKNRIRNAGGTNTDEYNNAVTAQSKIQELRSRLEAELQKPGSDKNAIAVQQASENDINNVKSLDEVVQRLTNDVSHLNSEGGKISSNKSLERSTYKAKTELANLQSQLHDYLKKSPGVESGMAEDVQRLQRALADPNAYKNVAALKQSFAELRAQAKAAGLETESLIDKFKNLFSQHFSTMITMAALHQMQNALQVVYQNVVQIDTALTELRKVSNMTASDMEKYMDRAAESAQKLGVSISDYISSTADWKRLGYSDEDAENLATYSTLLKNVGDGIDDVNTSSSYLISTLQGFGLLAEDAEDVVNKIDAVANTQPVTAEAIGEILTRSSAAMASANNTLSETIALGTTAYSVLQNAESTGTLLKTLSMYLRAAKSDLEDAGESAEGCANSVSELRSELKSLTGVDIMIDNKNFKSTYQIMKELSEVWGNLSDVTKANVTEMIGGKVYPYVQQCA